MTVKITDTEGSNVIQLIDGTTISSSLFYADVAQLTLSTGANVQILGASKFTFQAGANALISDAATSQTYEQFVTNLGTTLPSGSTPTPGTAGYVVPTVFTQAPAPTPAVAGTTYTAVGTMGNDVFALSAGNKYLGGGGDDTYIISPSTFSGSVTASIIDTEGANVIQLVDWMTVTSSLFYNDAVQLTLSTGANVRILGASKFSFQLGANAATGDTATNLDYTQFGTMLGASIPAAGGAAQSGSADFVVPGSTLPSLSVSGPAGTLNEAAGTASFTVSLSSATDKAVTVNYASADGTATAAQDYLAKSGTLTFAPGETSKTVAISLLNDAIYQGAHNFRLDLSSPSANATLSSDKSTATATLIDDGTGSGATTADDDRPRVVSISSPTITEGSNLDFVVTVSNAAKENYFTSGALTGNTATRGVDTAAVLDISFDGGASFTPVTDPSHILVPAGKTSAIVRLATVDDTLAEGTETVTLSGTAMTGASAQGIGTILDNDLAGLSVSVSGPTTAMNEAAGSLSFIVSLSSASALPVTVNYAALDGTAKAGQDYVASSGSLTFSPGETIKSVSINIINDNLYQGSNGFNLSLSNPSNAALGTSSATATLLDDGTGTVVGSAADNDKPTLTIVAPDVSEGSGHAQFTLNLDHPSTQATAFNLALSNGTASAGSDFSNTVETSSDGGTTWTAGTTVSFAANAQQVKARVAVIDDAVTESAETFTLTATRSSGVTLSDTASGSTRIVDNEGPPQITIDDLSVSEGVGNAVLTLRLSNAAASAISMDWTMPNGSATAGIDYAPTSGTLSFAPGETSKTISIPILNDTVFEDVEQFGITLSNPTGGAQLADASAQITILDDGRSLNGSAVNDDRPSVVSISSPTVTEGGNLDFVVTVSNTTKASYVVTGSLIGVTATRGVDTAAFTSISFDGGTTFTSVTDPNHIVVPAGLTSAIVRMGTVDDALGEGNETVTLTGTAMLPSSAVGVGTITDNDTPSVSVTGPTKATLESAGTLSFTVTLSNTSALPISVDYTTVNGSATAPADYVAASGSLTFAPGETSKTVSVNIIGDAIVAELETFSLTVSNPVNATLGTATGTATLDDAPTLTITSNKTALKAGESATLTFTLSEAASNFDASDVTVAGGTLSNFTGSGTSYTAIFTPTASSSTNGTASVSVSKFTDAAGNDNTDSNTVTMAVDTLVPTITIASNKTALKAGETATLTFTLSEVASNFVASDVTVAGGTLFNFTGSGTSYTATFSPTANSTTNGTASVSVSKFTDAAGNDNTASNTVTLAVDTVVPTISIASNKTALKAGESATLTFILSEAASNFEASDVTVAGGTLSNFTGSGSSYTATFTPTASSTTSGTASVATSKFTNATGNDNTTSNTVTLAVDTLVPTITIASNKTALKAGETATLTFTLSEVASNFDASDVTVAGGTLSNFTGSGSNYTATFTPTANSTTNGTASVATSKFTDAAGNDNTVSNAITLAVDTVVPSIAIASNKTALKTDETATLTFTLSEAASNFDASDVAVAGGTLSNFAGADSSYTATFTPTANSTTNGTASVGVSKFTDAAGNDNTDSNTVTMTVDTVVPTISIASNKTALRTGETATLTFTLSEVASNFEASDVAVAGGTLSNFAGSGTSYTATFTPTANSSTNGAASVGVSKFTDAAGNDNTASNTVTLAVDTLVPTITITITSNKTALKAGETATLTFILSEAASNFEASDVTVAGGTLSNFTGSGSSYTATFTPTASSTTSGTASVATSKFTNATGNDNTASNTVTMTVDTLAPTVTHTSAAYTSVSDTLVLTGINFDTLLETGEDASTDIKARLDWSKLSWDINGDNATTADVSFALGDITSAKVTDSTHLTVALTTTKGAALEATSGYGGTTADTLDISAGFAKDTVGNAATTDAVANAPLSVSPAGEAVIDLGAYGKLIAPVQVEGKWYYYWDRSGDGTSADTGSLNGGVDLTTHDVLDGIFNKDINGAAGGSGNTTDTIRFATLNGVQLALPTANGGIAYPNGIDAYQPGTAVNSGTTSNPIYDEYLAIWDAYNGTGTDTDYDGTPSAWQANGYWSATPSASGHAPVYLVIGYVSDTFDDPNGNLYVALQVL